MLSARSVISSVNIVSINASKPQLCSNLYAKACGDKSCATSNMKSYVTIALLVIFSAVVLCHPDDPEMRKHIEECNKEHNVSPKDFHDFMEGKLTTVPENLKCSSHCIMVKQGVMDESGNFKPDIAKTKITEEKFAAAVDECKDLAGSTPCDTAMKITEYMISHK